METTTFKAQLTAFINKAQEEADALRVKAALGRMEASEILEELGKEVNSSIRALSHDLKKEGSAMAAMANDYLERLRLQLTLGKAEAGKAYAARKESIQKSIHEIESWLKTDGLELPVELRLRLQNEMEKLQLKLDILRIRFELGKLEAREVMEEKKDRFKHDFQEIMATIKTETALKKEEAGNKLRTAYDALRRSWTS